MNKPLIELGAIKDLNGKYFQVFAQKAEVLEDDYCTAHGITIEDAQTGEVVMTAESLAEMPDCFAQSEIGEIEARMIEKQNEATLQYAIL